MPSKYASGKHAIAMCDRCGFKFKLKMLQQETVKTKIYPVKVCKECWSPDHPQLQLGMYPVNDPQAVRDPRPDVSYLVSGNNGLQINLTGIGPNGYGYPDGGSRVFQWGWNPVGLGFDDGLTPNDLIASGSIGTVSVTIS